MKPWKSVRVSQLRDERTNIGAANSHISQNGTVMPSIKGVIKGAYHASQLLFSLLWVLIYLRWSMWRAKKSFAGELMKHGVPKGIAKELAASYNEQNKKILKRVFP